MDNHFNTISNKYDGEIPEHIRLHLLEKKNSFTLKGLQKYRKSAIMGVDIGCGTGHYLSRIADHGYKMYGFDSSEGMVECAKVNNQYNNATIKAGDILHIPFPDNYFDFAYSINVFHHLTTREEQKTALMEVSRILKPGGVFFLHEINTDTFIFRFYMNYIFPLTNKIDDDKETELWVPIKWLENVDIPMLHFEDVVCYTFIPNFLPRFIFKVSIYIESFLEKFTMGKLGAHYMVTLTKNV